MEERRARRHGRPLAVLIAGGGVAAIEAALTLQSIAEQRVRVTLLSPSAEFRYRPLAVAEPFDPLARAALPLETVAADAGARLQSGVLARVDPNVQAAWTSSGERIDYDLLLVTTGARASQSIPGATTFWAATGGGAFTSLLEELRSGAVRRIVFAVPSGVTWSLPLYELALLTAADTIARGIDAELVLVTPESQPLAVFEGEASRAIASLLAKRGVEVITNRHPVTAVDGELAVSPAGSIPADAVVTLPTLAGPFLEGLPHDRHGFLPTDLSGVVEDVAGVFAAGDVTTFPVKQGGLAAQQAEAAAMTIAVLAGARVEPAPFQPVLRGRLITGCEPLYLRTELRGGRGVTSTVSEQPLWWPPGKIFGRRLGPYLAERAELLVSSADPVL